MIERHLDSIDYQDDETRIWRLCEWCLSRGADEFTLTVLGTNPPKHPVYERIVAPLSPFRRRPAIREHLSAPTVAEFNREAELWSLDSRSLDIVRGLFP